MLCEVDVDQLKNAKSFSLCFEAVSTLKMNFFKIETSGVKAEESTIQALPNLMGC